MIQGAVIYAKELKRLVTFYSALKFEIKEMKQEEYAVLTCASSELNIVKIPKHIAANIDIANPPKIRSETPIKLCFLVRSIVDTLTAVISIGGLTKGEQWEFRGRLIQDVVDPEGNVLQLMQANG